MENDIKKRNSWIACPRCGHKIAKARFCDIELKCKNCGHVFVAFIGITEEELEAKQNGKGATQKQE